MHKILSRLVTLPRGAVSRYFLPILVYRYLFIFLSQQTFALVKTSWRRLQRNIFLSFKTSSRHNCKTSSWRRLEEDVLQISLEDVLKTSSEEVLQTGLEDVLEDEKLLRWRRLQDISENKKCLLRYFLKTTRLLHINFLKVTSLKKPFHSISLSAGSHFELLWGYLWGMLLYSWELLPVLSYETFYKCFFYYSDSHCAKKNFTVRIPLLGALCSIFGPILNISVNV